MSVDLVAFEWRFLLLILMILCYLFGLRLVVACGPFIQLSTELVLLVINWCTVPRFLYLLLMSLHFLWFVQWSRLIRCLLGLLHFFTWKNVHHLCSSLLVLSGRMNFCVMLGLCCSRCSTGWRQGVMMRSLGSNLICALLLLLVPLGLMLLRWGVPELLGPPLDHNTGKYR